LSIQARQAAKGLRRAAAALKAGKVLNNAEAMAAFSQIGLSPDRPCRCYGDRMAAAVTEEEIDYAIERNEMRRASKIEIRTS
jgi:hypothetical protein